MLENVLSSMENHVLQNRLSKFPLDIDRMLICFFYCLYSVKYNTILDSFDVVVHRSGIEEIKFRFTFFFYS